MKYEKYLKGVSKSVLKYWDEIEFEIDPNNLPVIIIKNTDTETGLFLLEELLKDHTIELSTFNKVNIKNYITREKELLELFKAEDRNCIYKISYMEDRNELIAGYYTNFEKVEKYISEANNKKYIVTKILLDQFNFDEDQETDEEYVGQGVFENRKLSYFYIYGQDNDIYNDYFDKFLNLPIPFKSGDIVTNDGETPAIVNGTYDKITWQRFMNKIARDGGGSTSDESIIVEYFNPETKGFREDRIYSLSVDFYDGDKRTEEYKALKTIQDICRYALWLEAFDIRVNNGY